MGNKPSTKVPSEERSIKETFVLDETSHEVLCPFARPLSALCGTYYSLLVTSENRLFVAGDGDSETLHAKLPKNGPSFAVLDAFEQKKIVHASVGLAHFTAVTKDGLLLTWGRGSHGELGFGFTEDVLAPRIVSELHDVASAVAGTVHTLALLSNGEVYSFGSSLNGRLGTDDGDDEELFNSSPRKVEITERVRFIAARRHNLCISESGSVFSWGPGKLGVLGHGDQADKAVPTLIESLKSQSVICVATGLEHSACITISGDVWTWGCGANGRLGHESCEDVYKPKLVESLSGTKFISVSCGTSHTIACTRQGSVFAWGFFGGSNRLGGDNESEVSLEARQPQKVNTKGRCIVVACAGGSHSMAIDRDGTVLLWGSNSHGQCASGDLEDVKNPTPVKILGLKEGESVMTGYAVKKGENGTSLVEHGDN